MPLILKKLQKFVGFSNIYLENKKCFQEMSVKILKNLYIKNSDKSIVFTIKYNYYSLKNKKKKLVILAIKLIK